MEQPNMRERILAAAEKRVRAAGFAEMSFRDIAEDIGIKSASVHYHFKTKADLGEALVAAYTARFHEGLDAIGQGDLETALAGFTGLYNKALVLDEAICLCAIMGAEAIGLPPPVNARTSAFFEMNVAWLKALFAAHSGRDHTALALLVVTALEGAIIVSSTARNRETLETVAKELTELVCARMPDQAPVSNPGSRSA